MIDLSKVKNVLIVNTRSSGRKIKGAVMWGAWAVASYLRKAIPDGSVKFLDENNEDNFLEKFQEIVKDCNLVGFSITSMQIKYTLPLMKYLREEHKNVRIIAGGIHTILFPEQDYGGYVDEVIDYEFPKDYFDYDLLPEQVKAFYRRKRAQIITGFNCSYKCAFCVNSVRNCRYEGISLEKIFKDIDYVIREFNPPKIYFRDEDFYQDINKARAIVDFIIERGYKIKWEAASRVNHFRPGKIDDDFLEKIKKSGCSQFRFGVESGSQRVLNFLRKGQTVEQIKHAVRQCVKYDINASCSVMIGIPTETASEREETYKLITELHQIGENVEVFGPQTYRPYPGGLLYEEVKKYNLKFPEKFADWATYYDKNPLGDVFDKVVYYPWLTKKENETLPNTWVVAHYGLNYRKSPKMKKRLISYLLLLHWKLRWFSGSDLKLFMFIRRKFLKTDN